MPENITSKKTKLTHYIALNKTSLISGLPPVEFPVVEFVHVLIQDYRKQDVWFGSIESDSIGPRS